MNNKTRRPLSALILGAALGVASAPSLAASITYDNWHSADNEHPGNYVVTVDDNTEGYFNYHVTVSPWNAEALGLFFDLGGNDVGSPTVTNANPQGEVSLFATDTQDMKCGKGCNLHGPNASHDGEWELVFRLGQQGFDGIQTFSWTTDDFGLELANFALAGIRSQQLCNGDNLLPDESGCGGSDKAYALPNPASVPEPGSLALLALGIVGITATRMGRKK